ncbi:MAG: phosphonate C-P lyase system protein PhnH [Pseudomonadota bacterium]
MGHPQPSAFETETNATFDALMWALSRPGQARRLPARGMAGLVDALIDRECRVFAEEEAVAVRAVRAGAELVAVEAAEHVFAGAPGDAGMLDRLPLGSDLYPETGATLYMPARLGTGPALRLSGPGVEGQLTVRVDGLPQGFWPKRRAVMRYPMGFELFLIDGDQVMGVPRSTAVEPL